MEVAASRADLKRADVSLAASSRVFLLAAACEMRQRADVGRFAEPPRAVPSAATAQRLLLAQAYRDLRNRREWHRYESRVGFLLQEEDLSCLLASGTHAIMSTGREPAAFVIQEGESAGTFVVSRAPQTQTQGGSQNALVVTQRGANINNPREWSALALSGDDEKERVRVQLAVKFPAFASTIVPSSATFVARSAAQRARTCRRYLAKAGKCAQRLSRINCEHDTSIVEWSGYPQVAAKLFFSPGEGKDATKGFYTLDSITREGTDENIKAKKVARESANQLRTFGETFLNAEMSAKAAKIKAWAALLENAEDGWREFLVRIPDLVARAKRDSKFKPALSKLQQSAKSKATTGLALAELCKAT